MDSEIETVERRLKSFSSQLQTECGILERLVYKHKNQHRRCSYFQYILKVRRDLNLLKLANLEEVLDSSFIVINGNRPNLKVQLLESLKRKRSGSTKYNFLERLLGVTRLLSQMVEPLVKAAMEISKLFAQSFFMKFCVTILALLGRIRVLVQQILLDVVLVYNTICTLSQKEHSVKLNQDGFQVFREFYPRKEGTTTKLECVWQTDKFVLVEKSIDSEVSLETKDDRALTISEIQYKSFGVLLGGAESQNVVPESTSTDLITAEEDQRSINVGSFERVSSSTAVENENRGEDGLYTSTETTAKLTSGIISTPSTTKKELKKRVAFLSVEVNPPVSSARNESLFSIEKNEESTEDTFFNLLMGGVKKSRIL